MVQDGDTCGKISSISNVYIAQLYALNPSINIECTNLKIGQNLCISSSSVPPCAARYVVQSYQTCSSIAQTNGLKLQTLQILNPFINSACSNLMPGDNICVSSAIPTCNSTVSATTTDTCKSLQEEYVISTDAFMACNPTTQCSSTSISGQSICTSCTASQPKCQSIALASSGSTCLSMSVSLNVTLAQFQYWNQATNCSAPLSNSKYYCTVSMINCEYLIK
jgi:LysM repeat protein